MTAFGNYSRADMDMAVFVAKNSVSNLIAEITRVRHGKPDQNAFIYLSNHLSHINDKVIKQILTEGGNQTSKWTTGQLIKFLGEVKQAFAQDEAALQSIVAHIGDDLPDKSKTDLEKMVVILQKNIETYINDSKNTLALQHAEVIGKEVAKKYGEITEEAIKQLFEGKSSDQMQTAFLEYKKDLELHAHNLVGELQDDRVITQFLIKAGIENNTYLNGVPSNKDQIRNAVQRMFEEKISEIVTKMHALQQGIFQQKQGQLSEIERKDRESMHKEEDDLWNNMQSQFIQNAQKIQTNLAEKLNLDKLEEVKKKFDTYIAQVEASPDYKQKENRDLNDYIKILIGFRPALTDANITEFGKHAKQQTLSNLLVVPNRQLPMDFGSASAWMGDIPVIHEKIIKEAEEKTKDLIDVLGQVKKLIDVETGNLKSNNKDTFQTTMVQLDNHYPHTISALLSDFEKTATTGSSRFF